MPKKTLLSLTTAALSISIGGAAFAQFGGSVPGSSAVDARAAVYSKLVNTRLPVDFTENPLRDVVQFLADYGEIDILTKWDESGFGDGLDPEAQITIQLNNPTSLKSILEIVMNQATSEETSWNLGEGFIEIGLKEVLAKDKYVRLYPVRELIFEVPIFTNAPQMDLSSVLSGGSTGEITGSLFFNTQNRSQTNRRNNRNGALPTLAEADQDSADELIDIITSTIDPLQWEKNGGEGGSMRYFKGALIVNAPDFLHREVGGYPFAVEPSRSADGRIAAMTQTPRYVTLTGRFGFTKILNVEQSEIPVLVGGRVISSGGGG